MEDPAAAAAWLAEQRAWAREELASVLETLPDAPPSARTTLLEGVTAARRARRAALQRDVELVLGTDRQRWMRVEQALRRQRSPFGGGLAGEALDLSPLVERALRDVPGGWASMQPMLDAYERDWSAAAAERDMVLEDQLPAVLDATERRDLLALLSLEAKETAARRRVVQVNQDWYEQLSGSLPDAVINPFQRAVNQAWYPGIFMPSRAERTVAHFLADQELSEALRGALVRSRIRFGGPKLRLAAEERAARRASAGRDRTARAEQRAMAEVFGPTALFRLSESPADRALSDAASLASRRRALDVSWLEDLRSLLGSARWSGVPDDVLMGPTLPADRPIGDDGEPLKLRMYP